METKLPSDAHEPLARFEDFADVNAFCDYLFSGEPKEPGSCPVLLSEDSLDGDTMQHALFNTYKQILLGGYARLFGRDRRVSSLSHDERTRLGRYLESTGIRAHFDDMIVDLKRRAAQDAFLRARVFPWMLRIPDSQEPTMQQGWHEVVFEAMLPCVSR